jgi:very-short-patch-repair endonuclease
MTPPEAAIWMRLRERKAGRPTFRRQHAVGPYILDF